MTALNSKALSVNYTFWILLLITLLLLVGGVFELVVAFTKTTDLLSGSLTLALSGAFQTAIDDLIGVANDVIDGVTNAASTVENEGSNIGSTISSWGSSIGIRSLNGRDISLNFPTSRNFSFDTTIAGVDQGSETWFDAINPLFLLFNACTKVLKDTAIITFVLCLVLFFWAVFVAVQFYRTKDSSAIFKRPALGNASSGPSKSFGIGIIVIVFLVYLVSLIPFVLAATFFLFSKTVSFNGNFFFVVVTAETAGSAADAVLTGLTSFFLFVIFILAIYEHRQQKKLQQVQSTSEKLHEKDQTTEQTTEV